MAAFGRGADVVLDLRAFRGRAGGQDHGGRVAEQLRIVDPEPVAPDSEAVAEVRDVGDPGGQAVPAVGFLEQIDVHVTGAHEDHLRVGRGG